VAAIPKNCNKKSAGSCTVPLISLTTIRNLLYEPSQFTQLGPRPLQSTAQINVLILIRSRRLTTHCETTKQNWAAAPATLFPNLSPTHTDFEIIYNHPHTNSQLFEAVLRLIRNERRHTTPSIMMRTGRFRGGAPMSTMVVVVMICFLHSISTLSNGLILPSMYRQNGIIPGCRTNLLSNHRCTQPLSMFSKSEDECDNPTKAPSSEAAPSIWMPQLRRIMAGIAGLGVMETVYLTYTKIFTDTNLPAFCSSGDPNAPSACESVLTGPYSNIPFTNIPLATLGLVAYSLVMFLSLSPMLQQSLSISRSKDTQIRDDSLNRILLTSLSTSMGIFSIFLMVILFGVLHEPCPYCIFSAACSITLAQMAWIGGCLPENKSELEESTKFTVPMAVPSSLLVGVVAAVILYFGSSPATITSSDNKLLASSSATRTSTTLLVAGETKLYPPPEITTSSSERALKLAESLQLLDAKMYGAYWCSHCYDQKQLFGKQAFEQYLDYVECSKDGMNSQNKLCKAKDVPGYPTWEIRGKLYPGQQELDELEELVQGLLNPK
jgi:uncharacterized membrane protein